MLALHRRSARQQSMAAPLPATARLAIVLEIFLGVGALFGGGALILAPDGHLLGMPSKLLEFHRGKAMLRPTSRMAKMVMVLATAQRHPARMAQMIRCGARRTSARMEDVPRMRAGTLQRARKTPTTMISEITRGETPMETNLVGASAAPSHAPAVKPERMPRSCSLRAREGCWGWAASAEVSVDCMALVN